MAVYLIETPTGKHLVEARTGASALNHVLKKDTKVTTLSTGEMAKLIRQGMTLEAVADESPKADEAAKPTPIETAIEKEKEPSTSASEEGAAIGGELKEEPKHETSKSRLNLNALKRKA